MQSGIFASMQQRKTPKNPRTFLQDEGPFDLIGDVHGCCDELEELLACLGYQVKQTFPGQSLSAGPEYRHPEGRKAIFLGDLVDRGPRILDVLRLVHNMVRAGAAYCVAGNHDDKLMRKLAGRKVLVKHGLEHTMAEIEGLPDRVRGEFTESLRCFLERLPHHYVLDHGRLVVAHAGLKEHMQGKVSEEIKGFALYGATTGRKDEYGLPVRLNWAEHYQGAALVAHGHAPVPEVRWENNTVDLDTGCIYGGHLSALRYPEMEAVSIPARKVYYYSPKPFPSHLMPQIHSEPRCHYNSPG